MVKGAVAYDDLARTDPGLIAKIEAIMGYGDGVDGALLRV